MPHLVSILFVTAAIVQPEFTPVNFAVHLLAISFGDSDAKPVASLFGFS